MKAKKLPSGKWRVQVYIPTDTKPIRKSFTAETKKEAEYQASEYTMHYKEYVNDKKLSQAIEEYITVKTAVLSPSTIRTYRIIQRNNIGDLGDYSVNKITSKDIQAHISMLSTHLNGGTVKNVYHLIMSSLDLAVPDKKFKVTLPPKEIIERNIPDDEEVRLLIDNAPDDIKKCILLASVGTLRRGEISGLKYKDILRDMHAIYVHSDMVKDEYGKWIHKDIPKTSGSVRRIVFPKEIIDMLGEGDPEEFVIKLNPNAITNGFVSLRKRLGLKCKFHDLRHYAASIMHAIGIPDQYIQQRGGWSSPAILQSVYRNVLQDKDKAFTEKTNNYLIAKLQKTTHETTHEVSKFSNSL